MKEWSEHILGSQKLFAKVSTMQREVDVFTLCYFDTCQFKDDTYYFFLLFLHVCIKQSIFKNDLKKGSDAV